MPPSRRSADGGGLPAAWQRRGFAACLLYPVSLVFAAVAAIRRAAYRRGILRVERLPVPVVIVGNLTAGGSGKTPLVIHLAQALRGGGKHPGIVSRGYRGAAESATEVDAASDPRVAGDEPVLLARQGGSPVCVGRDRVAAARMLLAAHPEVDVIVADDGLQHYRLGRDVEIALFDERGTMNGWLLPAGPLRESISRLETVDAVVLNEIAVSPAPTFGGAVFAMRLREGPLYRLDDPSARCDAAALAGARLHAVAGIAAPQRFFRRLRAMGLDCVEHAFPDHHNYRADEFQFDAQAVLTTEKDAVKLAALGLSLPVWVVPVVAETAPDLARFVLERIDGRAPA